MKLSCITIPDDPTRIPAWLEQQLVGPDLDHLVAELEAVRGEGNAPDLTTVLDRHHGAVLVGGLDILPRLAIRTLLRYPELLLELREMVLEHGGAHWDRLLGQDTELAAVVHRVGRKLPDLLTTSPTRKASVVRFNRPVLTRPWLVGPLSAVAAAAAVLIAVNLNSPSGWGFTPEQLRSAQTLSEAGYLDRLAGAADQWFARRPDDAVGLAVRLGEMRQGCSLLILDEHPPLDEKTRTWLRDECRAWAARFSDQLVELERTGDVMAVREQADKTVRAMANNLRERAESVG